MTRKDRAHPRHMAAQPPLLTRVGARIHRLSRLLRGGPSTNSASPEEQVRYWIEYWERDRPEEVQVSEGMTLTGMKPGITYQIAIHRWPPVTWKLQFNDISEEAWATLVGKDRLVEIPEPMAHGEGLDEATRNTLRKMSRPPMPQKEASGWEDIGSVEAGMKYWEREGERDGE